MVDVWDRLASARVAVEQSCHLLLTPSPDVLDRCAQSLSRAIAELTASRNRVASCQSDARALAQLREIQANVYLASRLLENAAAYHDGWNRIMGPMLAGYTAQGGIASVSRPGRLAVEG